MEEILASIRRIISEDDAPAEEGAAEEVHEDEPAAEEPVAHFEEPETPVVEALEEPAAVEFHAPDPEPEIEDDDVLELTDKVETLGDLDVYVAPEGHVSQPAAPRPAPAPVASVSPTPRLVSDPAANAVAASFSHLSASLQMPREGRTLEDVVSEMLRPMLQQWLDEHLAGIVHQAVQAEVERISRNGRVG